MHISSIVHEVKGYKRVTGLLLPQGYEPLPAKRDPGRVRHHLNIGW